MAPIRSSEVIRGHPRSSEVIRGHPRSSEVIRGHPRSSEVISTPARSDGAVPSPASPASSATLPLGSSVGRAPNRPPRCLIWHRRPSRLPVELHHRLGWSHDRARGRRAHGPPSRACPPQARRAWRRVTRSPRPRRSRCGWREATPPATISHIEPHWTLGRFVPN